MALLLSPFSLIHAQNTTIEKKVVINDDGKEPKVTIETTINGKTTREVLTGKDARAYIEEHRDESGASAEANANGAQSSSTVRLNISSENFDKLEQELEALGVNISNEVTKLTQDVETMNIDSILESVGVQIEQSFNEFRYEFTTDSDDQKSVIIMKSSESGDKDEAGQTEVDVNVTRGKNGEQKTVTVKRTIIIEDDNTYQNTRTPKVDDLHFFPNPASNSVTVEFENEKDEPVTVEITDVSGKPYHTSTVSGKGSKTLSIDVSGLGTGNYLIRMAQGDRTLIKKLVIE